MATYLAASIPLSETVFKRLPDLLEGLHEPHRINRVELHQPDCRIVCHLVDISRGI